MPTDSLLENYNRRRDFSRTAEPAGRVATSSPDALVFAVQKHAASRLHFDLRLEWQGVLLSWAVTRGPSLAIKVKRLAVRTEDHPVAYAEFEGNIDKGQYGAGTVMLWDLGTWHPLENFASGLIEGRLKFSVNAQRMRGAWTLIRLKPKAGEKRENWLLIKERDQFVSTDENLLVREHLTSVSTGRTIDDIRKRREPIDQPQVGHITTSTFSLPTPAFVEPMLASTGDVVPTDSDWVHETKYDGYRCLAAIGAEGCRLYTRNGHDWRSRYVNLPAAFAELDCRSALLDGEIISLDTIEGPAFSALQRAIEQHLPVVFMAFDLLSLDGRALGNETLIERKARLRSLLSSLPANSPIQFAEHVLGNGPKVFEAITRAGGEGTIAKVAESRYRSGRSNDWLKFKIQRNDEFIIGGFSLSTKRGRPFSSLLLGSLEHGSLRYRGRVGSGFGEREFAQLAPKLRSLSSDVSPFIDVPSAIARTACWLKPTLVADIHYAELTAAGHVRQARFVGLRDEKSTDVVTSVTADRNPSASPDREVSRVTITNPERIVFPGTSTTKFDVAQYYERVAPAMIRGIKDRPLSLVRCPEGMTGKCFYQRHAVDGFTTHVGAVDIHGDDDSIESVQRISSVAGLVGAAQMGTLEFHRWGCRVDAPDNPDLLVFDLDPDPTVSFDEVKRAALDVRRFLEVLGLSSGALLSGGKGIHIMIPLRRTVNWVAVKTFSQTVAVLLSRREPNRFIATASKKRRSGKIFIDWLRNERGATGIAPWSTRARFSESVAIPLSWQDLKTVDRPDQFDLTTALELSFGPNPWEAIANQTLGKQTLRSLHRFLEH